MSESPLIVRMRCKPSARGRLILDELDQLGFKTQAAVRQASALDVGSVRRLIFTDAPIMHATFKAMKAIGVSEAALEAS